MVSVSDTHDMCLFTIEKLHPQRYAMMRVLAQRFYWRLVKFKTISRHGLCCGHDHSHVVDTCRYLLNIGKHFQSEMKQGFLGAKQKLN